ncbi:uncharacterized protein LOC127809675 [Diospyros lotus]|uniref:uncharacterized protein LOC127809675 n=1 Tax=Diospyros lotus TaxID=55363 RepID=UPI0022549F9F|nr:uncharacterized protein LOC127809675 [Diospyros lotus]XP_052204623.1 uncharacterized protein LOC127809675 [Diospyros lotus]
MGNCQAAEAATVVIQHPDRKVERIYWTVSAQEVMAMNPGHYVALVVPVGAAKSNGGTPAKQLKLLRPDDALVIGQVYRLISFEDVLKEFSSKKCGKLDKLAESSAPDRKSPSGGPSLSPEICSSLQIGNQVYRQGRSSGSRGVGRLNLGGGQWKPALQSIAEVGT